MRRDKRTAHEVYCDYLIRKQKEKENEVVNYWRRK